MPSSTAKPASCDICGALVANKETHAAWHLNPAPVAAEEAGLLHDLAPMTEADLMKVVRKNRRDGRHVEIEPEPEPVRVSAIPETPGSEAEDRSPRP